MLVKCVCFKFEDVVVQYTGAKPKKEIGIEAKIINLPPNGVPTKFFWKGI
jgi:hypothetical protein